MCVGELSLSYIIDNTTFSTCNGSEMVLFIHHCSVNCNISSLGTTLLLLLCLATLVGYTACKSVL